MILVLSRPTLHIGPVPHFADIFQAVGQAQQSLPETLSDEHLEVLDSLGPVAENFPAPLSGDATRMRFHEFPRDRVFLEHPWLTEGEEKMAFRFVRTADFWRLFADVVARMPCFGKCPVPMNTSGFQVLRSILNTRYGPGMRRDGYLCWKIGNDRISLGFPVGGNSGYHAIRLT